MTQTPPDRFADAGQFRLQLWSVLSGLQPFEERVLTLVQALSGCVTPPWAFADHCTCLHPGVPPSVGMREGVPFAFTHNGDLDRALRVPFKTDQIIGRPDR
jgi:hypothetical protein